jgi:hypothetical protein
MERTKRKLSRLTPHLEQEFLESPLHQQRFTVLLALLTAMCMSFTVFFAYNSSLERPVSSTLIFEKPERSILVLNIASQMTIFCLAELTSSVLESTRWAIASSDSGTPAYTFLALSRATSIVGVLCLLGKSDGPRTTFQGDGHRLWGSQRYVGLKVPHAY